MIKKRVILWWMLFIGIICHAFEMTNINVAIISMVKQLKQFENNDFIYRGNATTSPESIIEDQGEKVDWNQQEQNLILSAYYWLTWASGLLGGILSHKYGSKITFGTANFIACMLSSTIPVLARINYKLVVAVRILQGAFGTLAIPAAIITIIALWAPPHERGKFSSVTLGQSFGISIGYPFFAFIQSHFEWDYVFHITTALGAIWCIFWYFLVYDTPDEHPCISEKERSYIRKTLANHITPEKIPIPWKEMFTSVPLLINILCSFGQTWVFIFTYMYLPMYLKNVHELDSKKVGLISGISFLARSLLQLFGGIITDFMIRRGMSRTRVTNYVVLCSTVIPGFLLFGMPFLKDDLIWSLILLITFIEIGAFVTSGTFVALIDMSPNFCGVIQGIVGAISTSTGFLSPLVFNFLSSYYEGVDLWGYLFLVIGIISVIPGIIFVLFSDSELQSWNSPRKQIHDNFKRNYKYEDIKDIS